MAAQEKERLILADKNLYKGLFKLALPVMLANLLRAVYDLVDTFFLGGIADAVNAQAAVAIASPLINAAAALFMGLAIGLVAVMSRAVGEGDKRAARAFAGNAAAFGLILSLVVTAVIFFACPPLLRGLTDGKTLEYAFIYIRVRAFELPAVMTFELFRGARQAQGDTVTPVAYSSISVALNIGLTALFVFSGLGIFGASLSTVISQWAVVPLCAVGLFKSKKYLTSRAADLMPKKETMLPLLKVSVPSAVSGATAAIGFLVLQYLVRGYGDGVIAAFSVCNRITNILTVPIAALGAVLTAFIGQNLGNGNGRRALASYKASRNAAVLLMTVLAAAMFFCRAPVINLLSRDDGVREAALEYIVWALASLPLLGLFQNYCGGCNGYGKTGYTFIMEGARLWALRLPLVLLFNKFAPFGRAGIWYAMMISNAVICILGFVLLKIATRKQKINKNSV